MKKIKHIFLTLMLICLIVPPTSVFAEPEEAKPKEQKTEEEILSLVEEGREGGGKRG